jgi:DNA-binding FadR family transcriptional regulator
LTARLASERATSLDIEKIAYLAAAYDLNEQKCYAEPVPDNCKSVFQRDIDFHCAIAEASKSKELIKLIEQQHFIRRIMDNTNTGYLNRYSDKTYRRKVSHVQIVEAIQAHDPGKAEKLMRIHILDGKQEVVSTLLKQGEINESEEEFSF